VAKSGTGATRAEDLLSQLRLDVLSGHLAPGQRLKFSALTTQYGVSSGLLKEALSSLVEMGLATAQPNQGYSVVPLSAESLAELTEARLRIEPMVFGMSIANATIEWEGQLVAAHHVLERIPMESAPESNIVSDEWADAHGEFHRTMLAACSNSRLLAFAIKLRDEAELYRRWSVSLTHHSHRDLAAEHRGMMEAALDHDQERGVRLLADHICLTASLLVRDNEGPAGSLPTSGLTRAG
jgi:DNA-binding GntR family transcriptional regulator